jgi:hypothetical protein
MRHFAETTFASIVILLAGATQVGAQATRTWVSGVGDDANPCSRTAPCKTWAGAISKTAAGGEIDALDPGGFGAVTLTKSITLDGGPGIAGVLVTGTNGIVVAAGATDKVALRNLDIDGLGSGGTSGGAGIKGIEFLSGGNLVIDNCNIYGFGLRAISIESTTANAATLISNTIVHNNPNNGIWVGVSNSVVIDNVRSVNNSAAGLSVNTGGVVQVRNSVFSNNAFGLFSNNGTLDAQSVTSSNNGTGVEAQNSSTIRMTGVSVVNNTIGLSSNNSVINSFGDNVIVGNASGNTGVTPIAKQ